MPLQFVKSIRDADQARGDLVVWQGKFDAVTVYKKYQRCRSGTRWFFVLQGRFDAVTVFSKVSEAQIRHEVDLSFCRGGLVQLQIFKSEMQIMHEVNLSFCRGGLVP